MASDGLGNPLLMAFEQALQRLGATALTGDDEVVEVGYQEAELSLAWSRLQELLTGDDPQRWCDALAELVVETAADLRATDEGWESWQGQVVPVLTSVAQSRSLLRRAPRTLVWPFGEVLLLTAAVTGEDGLRYAQESQLAAWGVTSPELLATAVGNLRERTTVAMVQSVADHHYALDCGDGLDAARVLLLDELLPDARECGVVAAVPARDVLSCVPFHQEGCRHLRALVNLAASGYQEWPNPIDPGLFYLATGRTIHLPVTPNPDGPPRLSLPAELAEIQARLVDEGQW